MAVPPNEISQLTNREKQAMANNNDNNTVKWGIDPATEQLVVEKKITIGAGGAQWFRYAAVRDEITTYFAPQPQTRIDQSPPMKPRSIVFVETAQLPTAQQVYDILQAGKEAKAARIEELVLAVSADPEQP